LIPGFSAKLPKLVAATITAMKEIYRQFGARTVNPKPALKQLPKLFAHSDKTVRAEATAFAVILYTWLGDAIRPSLTDLKPLQLKELDEAFTSVVSGKATQERFLRSQKTVAGGIEEAEEEELAKIDAFDLAEPVDVRKNLPPEFHDWVVSTKWKERKDALEALLVNAKVPRIKEENYAEIIGTLGRCMKDANIAVVTVAAQCVEAIARGLRKPFGQYRQLVMMPMIEKLKERKTTVVEALSNAMDAVFEAVSPLLYAYSGWTHRRP
jgi:cytoskeleton-associated protein 5